MEPCLRLKVKLIRCKPRTIEVPSEILSLLSEEIRKKLMDVSVDDNQRFKMLVEELRIAKKMSLNRISKLINVPHATLWKWVKRLSVETRDRVTTLQLAKTKHSKRDFDGDDVERLKLWFLAHTDGNVQRKGQQVIVRVSTPDPYLVFLFKESFGRYGHVGVVPRVNSYGQYMWQVWVCLPLRSFVGLLEKEVPASIDGGKLYNVLSVAIDADGTINACKQTHCATARFVIAFYNTKEYLIKPLQGALTRFRYNLSLGKVPRGRVTTNGDYHHFMIRRKVDVKRVLECIKPSLFNKRLKARLIRYALSDLGKPVYWKDIELMYAEINRLHEEMLAESKRLAEALYAKWRSLRELFKSRQITRERYGEERERFRTKAWKALEGLKTKYDEEFSNLEKRIEACL